MENLAGMSLLTKGLLTTVCGLAGVFVVLTLFFVTLTLLQHIHTRDER